MNLGRTADNLNKAIKRMERQIGAYSFNYFQGKLRVLVGMESFKRFTKGLETKQIQSSLPDYPWKVEATIGGITFVALLNGAEEAS